MNIYTYIRFYSFLFLCVFGEVFPQFQDPIRYGGFIGGGYDIHSANFTSLRGVPNCCPVFENGTGSGFQLQGLVEIPFSQEMFLATRIGYTQRTGTLQRDESTTLFVNNKPTVGVFRHIMELNNPQILIDIIPHYTLFDKLSLFAGLSAGIQLNPIFNQRETIAVPVLGSTFADSNGNNTNQRIRNQFSGALPDANQIQLAIMTGMCYTLPLNTSATLLARPEVSMRIPITSFASTVSWNATSLQVGVSILFRQMKELEIPPIKEKEPIPIITENVVTQNVEVKTEPLDDKFILTGRILQNDGSPLKTTVIVEDLITGDSIESSESNSQTGIYTLSLDFGRNYSYSFIADGFYPSSKSIDLRSNPGYKYLKKKDVVLKSINELLESGDHVLINNIYFESDKSELKNASFLELNKLIQVLDKYPNVHVNLEAHTDNNGDDLYNDDLSMRRAKSVQEYLESYSVASKRITAKGFGERKPIAPNDTEEGRASNRRVQFRLELIK